jgi:mono/diheme cytochrome c family protein
MNKIALRLGFSAAALFVSAAVAAAGYFSLALPLRSDPASITVQPTRERVARGKYLYDLAACGACHSERDFGRFAGPLMDGGNGAGALLPGAVIAPNITPDRQTGLGDWSDGEIIRAIRDGIGRDGSALLPLMPYASYREMSDEDVLSLTAYLKTLPPVRRAWPRNGVAFPDSVLIRTLPRPAGHVAAIDPADRPRYGRYLATLGGCARCHTSDGAAPYSGGREFRYPHAAVASSNITPDRYAGIGRWTERDFIDRFQQYRGYAQGEPPAVGSEGFTVMPWLSLAWLSESDLSALYSYLSAVTPSRRRIETHPPCAVPPARR